MPRQRFARLMAALLGRHHRCRHPRAPRSPRADAGGHAADSIKYVYPNTPQLEKLKTEAAQIIDGEAKQIQEMVDEVFSFGEPGFQEFETVEVPHGHPRGERIQDGAQRRRDSDRRSSRRGDRESR